MPYNTGDILLDKCRIEEMIGKGAFGEVYRVTHLKLNALRALKVLRKDVPDLGSTEYGEYQDRFKLEAQLGAKLDHPNIIKAHDLEEAQCELFRVTEYAPMPRAQRTGWNFTSSLFAVHFTCIS